MDYYIIGYDLNKGEGPQDYNALYRKIKSVGDWWHSLGSTWIVKSDKTADEIHDVISEVIDKNDELLVALLCDEVAWSGFKDKGGKWLEDNFHDCKKNGSKRKKSKDKDKKDKGNNGLHLGHDKDKSDKSDKSKSKTSNEGHAHGHDKDGKSGKSDKSSKSSKSNKSSKSSKSDKKKK